MVKPIGRKLGDAGELGLERTIARSGRDGFPYSLLMPEAETLIRLNLVCGVSPANDSYMAAFFVRGDSAEDFPATPGRFVCKS
jgi:hypothetical protein